jgi:hypothetical protein
MNFPKGLFANKPHEKAPDFVKCAININRDEFITWLQAQGEKVNLDIKENKGGKWYASVNEYKKETDLPF